MPVGHIWKFDLEEYELRNFGVKCNFSKIRIGHVMLKFLATTENIRKIRPEQPIYNCGKVLKKAAGNCYSQFPDLNQTRVELSYPEIGEEAITKEEHIHSRLNRVNPQRKGGQLGCPNGPVPKLNSRVKIYFPCWNSIIANFSSY